MSDKNEVFIDQRANIVYLPGANAIGKLPASGIAGAKPTAPINSIDEYSDKIAAWGTDNLFPQKVLKECETDTIVPTTLRFMARALYGAGLKVGKVIDYKDDGTEIFKPQKYQPWIDFAKRSNINRYLIEACNDFYWFYNVFPEFILTKNREEIHSINCQEAMYSRWGMQDQHGLVNSCYIHGNWDEYPAEKDLKKIAVIDPYNDPVATTKSRSDSWKYIYPLSYPSPGKTYYQLAHWNSLRTSGWLDYAKAIPEIKKNYSINSVRISMVLEVADWFWTWKYKDWDEKPLEQEKRIKETYQGFNDFIAGKENAGKTLFLPVKTHPETFEPFPGWKISAVDKGSAQNRFIEDSNEPSSHLLYALGVDPAIIGMAPGKSLGAGGSDKRVAFNVYVSLCQADRDVILEPLNFIRDYNGWDTDIEFRFTYPMITTLDKGKESQQQTS